MRKLSGFATGLFAAGLVLGGCAADGEDIESAVESAVGEAGRLGEDALEQLEGARAEAEEALERAQDSIGEMEAGDEVQSAVDSAADAIAEARAALEDPTEVAGDEMQAAEDALADAGAQLDETMAGLDDSTRQVLEDLRAQITELAQSFDDATE